MRASRQLSATPGAACLLAAAMLSGCGESLPQQLHGRWEGRPDSVAAREARNPRASQPAGDQGEDDRGVEATDLEAFDFRITLDFAPQGVLSMRLGDGPERKGSWRLEPQAAGYALLELTGSSRPPPTDAADESRAPALGEQRRFELLLENGGDGFTLREEGADPQFGWLYFERKK